MTYTLDKIQGCEIFVNNEVIFHKNARIPAKVLYSHYKEYLTQLGLENAVVEPYNFWSLLKAVVPKELVETLNKRTSKFLLYVGLDLKKHSISNEIVDSLKKKGLLVNKVVTPSIGEPNLQLAEDLGQRPKSVNEFERCENTNSRSLERGEIKIEKRKRGRPRKNPPKSEFDQLPPP